MQNSRHLLPRWNCGPLQPSLLNSLGQKASHFPRGKAKVLTIAYRTFIICSPPPLPTSLWPRFLPLPLHLLCSNHSGSLLILKHTSHSPISGPFHMLFPLLGKFLPQTPSYLISSLLSNLCSDLQPLNEIDSTLLSNALPIPQPFRTFFPALIFFYSFYHPLEYKPHKSSFSFIYCYILNTWNHIST